MKNRVEIACVQTSTISLSAHRLGRKTGWPVGYSLREGVELGTPSASGGQEGLNLGPPDYKSSAPTADHACLTTHAVCLFLAIQCWQKYYLLRSLRGYAWNLIFAGAFNLLYLFHFNFGALFTFRVLQKAVSRCLAAGHGCFKTKSQAVRNYQRISTKRVIQSFWKYSIFV